MFSIRAALLALFLCSTAFAVTKVTRPMKDATIVIEVRHNSVELTIHSIGVQMRNTLYTKNPGISRKPLDLVINCGGPTKVCVKDGNITYATLEISSTSEIVNISRSVRNVKGELRDCYELANGMTWFGGPQLRYQQWPIQNMYFEEEPYVPSHPVNMAVSERYWLSGHGIYLYVNENVPLFLDQNNIKPGYICFVAKNKSPYRERSIINLDYEFGIFRSPRMAHEHVVKAHLGKPSGIPNTRMIQYPIWSTWARYKANVSEKVVTEFANEIVAYKFPNSQLEIDDNWETCYGSAVFDPKKFPNVTNLTKSLKQKGFRVTLWIHPFINEKCEPAYSTALKNNYFVKSLNGKVHMSWWQGADAAAIDFTNPKAVAWWVGRLKLLQNLGIDSFKFDAGEGSWLPQIASLTGPPNMQPGIFTYDYVRALSKNFDDNIEVRVGWRSQDLPIFVRMIDKDTKWTMNNGIPTLITTLLQMNLNGYVHVLPDMIGGNGYLNGFLNGTEYPPKELFIRWLQANVFMPSLQYSFVPWDFDNETVAISRKFTELHAKVAPKIIECMRKAAQTGSPVNPPIWWVDPQNPTAHKIADEFLLCEDILAAPVVEEDVVTRDVYLPSGRWQDGNTNETHIGPKWLMNYPAPLDVLPYFNKLKS